MCNATLHNRFVGAPLWRALVLGFNHGGYGDAVTERTISVADSRVGSVPADLAGVSWPDGTVERLARVAHVDGSRAADGDTSGEGLTDPAVSCDWYWLDPAVTSVVVSIDPDACAVRMIDHDKVAAARARMIPDGEAQQLTELFRLLGDPTRADSVRAGRGRRDVCVRDLAGVVDAPETSVSHALRLLRTAGVVRNRKSGRMVYYSLNDAHVRLLFDVSAEHLRYEPNRW